MFAFRELVLLLLCTVCVCEHGKIKKALNLASLEEAVKGDSDNTEELQRTCSPINNPAYDAINVVYTISCEVSAEDNGIIHAETGNQGGYIPNSTPGSVEHNGNFTYQWMTSPVLGIIPGYLLERLSLYTFQYNHGHINLSILLTPGQCDEIDLGSNDDACVNPPLLYNLLNELTSDLFFIVKDPSGNNQEKGHVELFNTTSNSSCVINGVQRNNMLHIIIIAMCCTCAFFFSVCCPTIYVGVRRQLHKKMSQAKSDWKFYIEAIAIVSSLVAFFLLIMDFVLLAISWSQEDKIFLGFLIGIIVVSFFANFLIMLPCQCCKQHPGYKDLDQGNQDEDQDQRNQDEDQDQRNQDEDQDQRNQDEDQDQRNCCKNRKSVCSFFFCWFFTLFLILFSFHFIFFMLGALVSPVVALAHFTFYITSLFSVIASVALVIKFINKSECKELCGNRDGMCQLMLNIAMYTPPVLAALSFLSFVICTGLLYFFLIEMVQNSQPSHDLFSVLSTFLPSAALGFATISAKQLMTCGNT